MIKVYFGFLLSFLLFSQNILAAGKPFKKAEVDSIRKVAVQHRHERADSIKMNVVQVHFSPEYADSLLQQMEAFHIALNTITNETKYSFKTRQIEKDLHSMEASIDIIGQSLSRDSSVVNVNNLQMFRGLLKDMEAQLKEWRDVLNADNKDLQNMTSQMNAFVRDSFTQKVASDTAFARLHLDEMLILNDRWKEAKTSTGNNLSRINGLQAEVSGSYFDVTELQNKVGNMLAGSAKKASGKEYNYIWDLHSNPTIEEVMSVTGQSIEERLTVLKYYLLLNTEDWSYFVIAGLFFFFWVVRNFRRIKNQETGEYLADLTLKYIGPIPVISTMVFILTLAPFYGFNQPAIYIEILQLLMLVPLTILLWKIWPRNSFLYWCALAVLMVLTSGMNAIITPGWPLRFFLLGLNSVSIFYGIMLLRHDKKLRLGKIVKVVSVLYIILNCLAVLFNLTGRLTLAKLFAAAAVQGLVQIISLFVFIEILIEGFYLQMQSSRISGGMSAKFNYVEIQKGLFKLLTSVAIILWLITFATNLSVYSTIVFYLDKIFNTPRSIGSTTFTYGNILTFILILYVVSILQKYVGYFFGETEDDFVSDLDKKESRLVIVRLVIIMIGFFLAVVASGLPVDKVTVVLGALGVGIGLGLQNIVFNLVSGVILIFEKPMQIGDYIEVGDKKGRVQNIGIRSSKLITPDGSEVIVPNGDILSSHMVNWTRSNNNRRAEVILSIEPSSELQAAKDIILAELKNNPLVIQERAVDILISNMTESSVDLKVNVWINSIYKEQEFKSELLSGIYNSLAAKGIKIVKQA